MEIFDCFCGIGAWQTRDRLLPYTPEDMLALMDHFGIGKALVHSNFTVGNGSPKRGNLILTEACAPCARFIPAFTFPMYPYDDSSGIADTLEAMRTAGARAVWHILPRGMVYAAWLYGDILEACAAHSLPLFAHRDVLQPDAVHQLLRDFPALNVVLVGVGYGDDWWLYPLLRQHPRLHVALGHVYVVAGNPMRFLRHFPAERLLFGSGLPLFSPGGLVAHVMYADLKDTERELIMRGNLERLLAEVRL